MDLTAILIHLLQDNSIIHEDIVFILKNNKIIYDDIDGFDWNKC